MPSLFLELWRIISGVIDYVLLGVEA